MPKQSNFSFVLFQNCKGTLFFEGKALKFNLTRISFSILHRWWTPVVDVVVFTNYFLLILTTFSHFVAYFILEVRGYPLSNICIMCFTTFNMYLFKCGQQQILLSLYLFQEATQLLNTKKWICIFILKFKKSFPWRKCLKNLAERKIKQNLYSQPFGGNIQRAAAYWSKLHIKTICIIYCYFTSLSRCCKLLNLWIVLC